MTTTTVRFDAPAPDILRRPESRAVFAAALKDRPGEWALFGKCLTQSTASTYAWEIRNARSMGMAPFAPAGAFEAESRTLFGEHRVYVRYVGGAR